MKTALLSHFIHITLSKNATNDALETAMNKAIDWFRISENTWIFYTTSDATKWYVYLLRLSKKMVEFSSQSWTTPKRKGWMDKSFWQWVRKDRTKKT